MEERLNSAVHGSVPILHQISARLQVRNRAAKSIESARMLRPRFPLFITNYWIWEKSPPGYFVLEKYLDSAGLVEIADPGTDHF